MNRKLWIAAFAFSTLAPAANAGVVTVRFDPPSQTVNLNDIFTVDLVADIPDAVVGWGLDLTIDAPGIISLVGDPAIPNPPWVAAFAPDGDKLAALANPFEPTNGSVSGISIVLATLTFSADSLGQTDLILGTTPGDLSEGFALDPTGFATITFETGQVTVVPEPTTLLPLLVAGLLVAHSKRRLRR